MVTAAELSLAPTERVLGLVRIGRVLLAVPAESILEVVKGPLETVGLPQAPRHVLGMFTWHGRPLPLIDLAELVRGERDTPTGEQPAFGLVVQHEGGGFAVAVEEVLGVRRAAPKEIVPFDGGGEGDLFREVYQPANGAPAALLDWSEVVARKAVRKLLLDTNLTGSNGSADESGSETDQGEPHVLVKLWGQTLAIAVDRVNRVQRRPERLDSELRLGRVTGFLQRGDHQVPVMDLGKTLGWSAPADGKPLSDLVLVGSPEREVGLGVEGVVGIEHIAADAVGPSDDISPEAAQWVQGVWQSSAQGPVWVMNGNELESLGWTTDGDEDEKETNTTLAAKTQHFDNAEQAEVELFLVARLGSAHIALPALAVQEVMPIPSTWIRPEAGELFCGLLELKGRATKMFDLAVALDLPAVVSDAAVAVVTRDSVGDRGWLVSSLDLLVRQVPSPLASQGLHGRGRAPAFTRSVKAQADGWRKEVCVVDLASLNQSTRDD